MTVKKVLRLAVLVALIGMAFEGTAGYCGESDTASPGGNIFDVRRFGAVADGKTFDTHAIQAAIDACTEAGGGQVLLRQGTFLSKTIVLKDNVSLNIQAGAVLLGSSDLKDYPSLVPKVRSVTDWYADKSLIHAEGAKNISITGSGTINGQGACFKNPDGSSFPFLHRPFLIRIIQCQHVLVRDILLRDSAMWVGHYLACDDVTIDNVRIRSRVNENNDGVGIDSCRNVRVANCHIVSGDDAIVMKSSSERVCENVTVTNCVISSGQNAIKTGTESNGGFQNITVSNCTIYDNGGCGILLTLVDGGLFKQVTVSNINMHNVRAAICLRLGNRGQLYKDDMKRPGMGAMRNIIIKNVQATKIGREGCSLTGLPGHPIRNVTLENIRLRFKGGIARDATFRTIPELPGAYPEWVMFGILPSYGFYCRHLENLRLKNIDMEFEEDDFRPALICDDVRELVISDLRTMLMPSAHAMIWLKHVQEAWIEKCRPQGKMDALLRVEGDSRGIRATQNCLRNAEKANVQGSDGEEVLQ